MGMVDWHSADKVYLDKGLKLSRMCRSRSHDIAVKSRLSCRSKITPDHIDCALERESGLEIRCREHQARKVLRIVVLEVLDKLAFLRKCEIEVADKECRTSAVGSLYDLVPIFVFSPVLLLDKTVVAAAVDLAIEISCDKE